MSPASPPMPPTRDPRMCPCHRPLFGHQSPVSYGTSSSGGRWAGPRRGRCPGCVEELSSGRGSLTPATHAVLGFRLREAQTALSSAGRSWLSSALGDSCPLPQLPATSRPEVQHFSPVSDCVATDVLPKHLLALLWLAPAVPSPGDMMKSWLPGPGCEAQPPHLSSHLCSLSPPSQVTAAS
jgi:hypothetical protein